MRKVWQVFLRDCRRILRNPVAVVVTLGVAILPSLYAWFNILANWDPYSATGNLQVAVANEDQGTTNDLVGHLDAGRQVVKKLKQNDELGWRFVDNEEQAVHGVETGEYYAAIVLPKDFSTSLVESVTGTSKQPKIKYYVNEKKNAIAPKITDTGATTIDEQINSAFVTTVATTVASAVSEAGGDLDQATGKVQHDTINDLNTVMSTLNTVQDSLTDLQDTLAQSDTILADAKQTTASLRQTVAAAQKASRQSGTLLAETQAGSQAFSTTLVGALDTSSAQLSGLAVHVNNAAGSITGSFNSAQNSVDTITNTLSAPLNATQTSISDLKDALTKAGIGKDTTDPVGQNIWKQIDALDSLISKQQTQLNTFHTDTTQFINSGKDATTNLSGAMTNTTTGGIAALNTARGSLTGTVMPSLTSSLNSFAALNGTLDGTLTSLSGTLDQADGLFDQLVDTLNQTKTTISSTQD
ncbi:YhgE/Pip domain-containing protein, partial [Bifidobacterium longum]